mmetsp:Transcript_8575/g.21834  ORF Transcript_8575/g.21834 Transcript_8575/m.21834 type:complete len:238 (-) Transcript_8575:87-800(-)
MSSATGHRLWPESRAALEGAPVLLNLSTAGGTSGSVPGSGQSCSLVDSPGYKCVSTSLTAHRRSSTTFPTAGRQGRGCGTPSPSPKSSAQHVSRPMTLKNSRMLSLRQAAIGVPGGGQSSARVVDSASRRTPWQYGQVNCTAASRYGWHGSSACAAPWEHGSSAAASSRKLTGAGRRMAAAGPTGKSGCRPPGFECSHPNPAPACRGRRGRQSVTGDNARCLVQTIKMQTQCEVGAA